MWIVYNSRGNGLYLSKVGIRYYNYMAGTNYNVQNSLLKVKRTDPYLVEVIRKYGYRASNMKFGLLNIINIPNGSVLIIDNTLRGERLTWS